LVKLRVVVAAVLALGVSVLTTLTDASASGFDYLSTYVGPSQPDRWFMFGDFQTAQGGCHGGGNSNEFEDLVSTVRYGDFCGNATQVAGPLGAGSVDVRYAGLAIQAAGGNYGSSCNGTGASACLELSLNAGGFGNPGVWRQTANCVWVLPSSTAVMTLYMGGVGDSGPAAGTVMLDSTDHWDTMGITVVGDGNGGQANASTSTRHALPPGLTPAGLWSQVCVVWSGDWGPSNSSFSGSGSVSVWVDGGNSGQPNLTYSPSTPVAGYSGRGFVAELDSAGDAVWGYGMWESNATFFSPVNASSIASHAPNGQCYSPTNGSLVNCLSFQGDTWPYVLWSGAFGLNAGGLNGTGISTSTTNSGWGGTTSSGGVPCSGAATQAPLSGDCKLQVPKLAQTDCSQYSLSITDVGADVSWLSCQLGDVFKSAINGVIYGVDAIIDLIEPGPNIFNPITALLGTLQTHAPFGYLYGAVDAVGNMFSASSQSPNLSVTLWGRTIPVHVSDAMQWLVPYRTVMAAGIYVTTAGAVIQSVRKRFAT
jgi:hypothetical protein